MGYKKLVFCILVFYLANNRSANAALADEQPFLPDGAKVEDKISSSSLEVASFGSQGVPGISKLSLDKVAGVSGQLRYFMEGVWRIRNDSKEIKNALLHVCYHKNMTNKYSGMYKNEKEAASHTKKYFDKVNTLSKAAQDALMNKALNSQQAPLVYHDVIACKSITFLSVDKKRQL